MNVRKEPITFTRVTTRGGDRGESSLYSGERVRKDDFIFEVLGDLDELNSSLGIVRSYAQSPDILQIQKNILVIGAVAATSPESPNYEKIKKIESRDVTDLEKMEQKLLSKTSIKSSFICPGDTSISAFIDVSRTLARRCERRIVTLIRERSRADLIAGQQYLNRLSDYLFILARYREEH
jgi:cob(I)alamin adenosyltransferase